MPRYPISAPSLQRLRIRGFQAAIRVEHRLGSELSVGPLPPPFRLDEYHAQGNLHQVLPRGA